MKYRMWKLYTSKLGLEVCANVLMANGLSGMIFDDPEDVVDLLNKKHDYEWDYVDDSVRELAKEEPAITIYFDHTEEGQADMEKAMACVEAIKEQLEDPDSTWAKLDLGRLEMEISVADDEDWKDKWKEYFKPAHITERIVVKPSWEEYERQSDEELIIEIDPGMAFGTGTHPTTTLCVKLLEKYIESPKDVVLDVGCGSGILAMAAALLGVEETVGVEIDPVAVDVAKENVALNGLTDKINVIEGDLTKGLDMKADIVVANLMADLVMMLTKDVAKHLRGKAVYISSGILIEKQPVVSKVIRDCGFEILEILEQGEWCAIAARLKDVQ
ncbi:MAG: 50S ribosomal protein L11 methyltransferase [Firmicutes bacterium]|nr:50S ribosomal protein L11 methyltransferase [Bacillota bacterium]